MIYTYLVISLILFVYTHKTNKKFRVLFKDNTFMFNILAVLVMWLIMVPLYSLKLLLFLEDYKYFRKKNGTI